MRELIHIVVSAQEVQSNQNDEVLVELKNIIAKQSESLKSVNDSLEIMRSIVRNLKERVAVLEDKGV
ncbi:hypothetical protein BKH41_03665 [Helicobacter sp. 12S02232-10]|uniref:hypothetical protein n=1 Tax=Helicobacter sp. 12S02232-10 TaxID=1476197 RepID=UPI000BA67698|nr:hypothetical protein [Helicobacter sp. 12S02232-10]PAF49190.1 hypothetical protein BKH41_03665 [Helicobacter sp. 12S02232-10]